MGEGVRVGVFVAVVSVATNGVSVAVGGRDGAEVEEGTGDEDGDGVSAGDG